VETDGYPSVAVVVPFRNEVDNLPVLLRSLYAQHYSGDYEIILVDDFSTDGGGAIGVPDDVNLRTLQLRDYPLFLRTAAHKKSALTLAISQTDCQVIVTTDADCQWQPGALQRIGEAYRQGADVVLGPVLISPATDFCSAFQALDMAAYQLFTEATVTSGHPALANGANFSFRKQAFDQVGGYRGVDHLPSGDDVLLLHKFAATPGLAIRYTGDAESVVRTLPVTGWQALWQQRLRWAGKAGSYASPALTFAQAIAFCTSAVILICLGLGLADGRFALVGLFVWGVKALVDATLLRALCIRYDCRELMRWYPLAQLIYPIYLVSVGTAALLGVQVSWKGRP
ncbi:MAG: glycosyltransferase, partial [Lewinella sp.]